LRVAVMVIRSHASRLREATARAAPLMESLCFLCAAVSLFQISYIRRLFEEPVTPRHRRVYRPRRTTSTPI
jgi:hypothetical protein